MSASPEKANTGDGDGASKSAPNMTEVEMETAFLRSVVDTRPVGPHKHFLVIQLQAELFRRTETMMPIEEIWRRIEDMFDVTALDRMASPESIPDSPKSLSPLPKSSRHPHRERATSESSLSNVSRSPSPSAKPSKSAKLINSSYFGTPFTLPYFRLNQNEWKPSAPTGEAMKRQRSRSVASGSTHTDTEKGFMLNEEEVEMYGPELQTWHDTIYDGRPTEGVDQAAEEELWDVAQKQIAERDAAAERAVAKEEKAKPKRRAGRPSKARKEKEDTSELSDAAADAAGEEEEEEEAPKTARGRRANAGKRRRGSTAKEESEDEKEVKDTKSKRKRK